MRHDFKIKSDAQIGSKQKSAAFADTHLIVL
jgi:hypothetical protein